MNVFNNTSNSNKPPQVPSQYYDKGWVYAGVGIYVPLSILIILGNGLVIAAFYSTPKLKTKTNYFIVSLAVADLFVGTFSVPMWTYILITEDFTNQVYRVYLSVDMVSGVSSIMHLTCISLERCYAIVDPLRHMRIKKGILYFAIVMSWGLGIISPLLKEYSGLEKETVAAFITCVFFFAPLLVILVAYVIIFTSARKSIAIRRGNSIKKDLHIAYTVALVIGVFLICWLPFFLILLLFNFCLPCKPFVVKNMSVLMTVKLFHYFNSVCNPIIYCVRNKRFYLAFTRILRRMFCCKKSTYLQEDLDSTKMANYRNTIRHKNELQNGERMRLTLVASK